MSTEVPVFMTRIECPVCKTVNEYETIKMGAYVENGRDTDFCPTNRVWRNRKYGHINPLLYFMTTCSSCFYTREFNKSYKEWKSDSAFRSYRQKVVRERHLNALADPGGIIKPLGAAIDPQHKPRESAILKLLLGIFEEQMLDRPGQLDLGRWYLRIGWLFRELAGGVQSEVSTRQVQLLRRHKMLRFLRDTLKQSEQQIDSLQQQFEEQDASGESADQHFLTALGTWRSNLQPITDSLDELLSMPAAATTTTTSTSGAPGAGSPFAGFNSVGEFLASLPAQATQVPRNEIEAMALSLQHYRQAYEGSRDVSGSNQKIQVAYMIGELARRVGEFDQAQEYFAAAIRNGHEFVHQFRADQTKTALARKIVEMAIEQSKTCKPAEVGS